MSWIDAVGHVAYFLIFVGVLLVGRKLPSGWLLYIAGDLLWLYLGWEMHYTSIMLWQAIFLVQALYNWNLWRKDKVNPWRDWTKEKEA